MNKRRSLQFLVIGLLVALFVGCAMFEEKSEPVVVGTWTNPLGTVWTISPNGTFDVDLNHNGKRDAWGSYKIHGDEITFRRTGGLNPTGCGGPGVYKFQRDGDKLTFTVVNDKCKLRKKNVTLPWKAKK